MAADWGVAITGNAGPAIDENASKEAGANRVGRCYIAVAGAFGVDCQTHDLHGDRADIQFRATNWAIDILRRKIIAIY
jgi:nicotinamide mononucleotide (NMN) deamidase PncC